VQYVSTRGAAPTLGFADALLAGLARDGGLYLPLAVPHVPPDAIRALRGVPYPEAAARIMAPFVGEDFDAAEIESMSAAAYAGFRHAAVAPLTQIDANLFTLELFHGPTLAFKDFAMQWLGEAMNRTLRRRGARATIIGATSGDTGAAAIEAFAEQSHVEVFILYPQGRVSDVQRRQMTTVDRPNVHALAIQGAFDDCQRIVKELFGDLTFRDEMRLSGVNSINWARILAQIVYYFVGAVALGAPERPISFAVPTGNFGDVLAGYYAKRMGLPVERLIVATNENDILARALATGRYAPKAVKATQSPSMDIQVSSNFERLLFEASGRDPEALVARMNDLAKAGSFVIPADALARIRADFDAFRVDEAACAEEMRRVHRASGAIIDPHSAVGVHAARKALSAAPTTPVVALSTAHPAKFPDAVERATGVRPRLPERLSDLMKRKEAIVVLPNDRWAVADYLRQTVRAAA
jgi:threonine synthase